MAEGELQRLPKVTGNTQLAGDPAVNKIMARAIKELGNLKDEYLSTEHLLLALLEVDSTAKEILTVNSVNFTQFPRRRLTLNNSLSTPTQGLL